MGIEWRLLSTVRDDQNFATTVRNVMLVGFGVTLLAESMAYVHPTDMPADLVGAAVMAPTFAFTALLGHLKVHRHRIAPWLVFVCAVLGWYHARMVRADINVILKNQGAVFLAIAGSQAVLLFSVAEFIASLLLYLLSLFGFIYFYAPSAIADFTLLAFYSLAAMGMAAFGILGRTRLQDAQLRAQEELKQLNLELESRVQEQVKRIRRAELLRRFLPPELGDSLLAGGQSAVEHKRRNVAVVCAAPAGFLEGLSRLGSAQVVELVNAYVARMSQVAFEHGGVVERVVGPRMTVIFGATSELEPAKAVENALRMSTYLQMAGAELLGEWEKQGIEQLRLRLAVGVAWGSAVVGTFGSERRADYSALGGVMVRAVRLSSEAIPGEIRLDAQAAKLIPDDYETTLAEPVEFFPGEPAPCYIAHHKALHRGNSYSIPPASSEQVTVQLGPTMTPAELQSHSGPVSEGGPILEASLSGPVLGELFDGRYRLESLLGKGGMATVYRARHMAHDKLRALKIIESQRLDTPDAVSQFRREAEATSRIRHPNVVKLHDFGRSLEGRYYLALELVEGHSLAQLLDASPRLPLERTLKYAYEILLGLEAAHQRGLVHQDLKPSNVLVDLEDRALVTDFGLVTAAGVQTRDASFGGTPAYMSPEQWQNQPLDGRSDLYSFGVLLFELLTGKLPLKSESVKEFATLTCFEAPPSLAKLRPDLPRPLSDLVDRCLTKTPEQRPASAQATAEALWDLRTPETGQWPQDSSASLDSLARELRSEAPTQVQGSAPDSSGQRLLMPRHGEETLVGGELGLSNLTVRGGSRDSENS